jgi:hypothetical protein
MIGKGTGGRYIFSTPIFQHRAIVHEFAIEPIETATG